MITKNMAKICWNLSCVPNSIDIFPEPLADVNLRDAIYTLETQFSFLPHVSLNCRNSSTKVAKIVYLFA